MLFAVRKLYPACLVLCLGLLFGHAALAADKNDEAVPPEETNFKTELSYDFRFGYHAFPPIDLATDRHEVHLSEKIKFPSHWTIEAGGRAWVEGAYASNPGRFHGQVVTDSTSDIRLRDLYAQYRNDWLTVRAGNQQVVWGETFGFYYADIVNPKDLRELGIGDLSENRLMIPMLNAKGIWGNYSAQLLYIPKPYFDLIALPGSDFAYPFDRVLPGATFTIEDPGSLPLALSNGEVGARVDALISGIDLSAFYLYYYDRLPNYSPQIVSIQPLDIQLNGYHTRISSFGATATADLGLFVLRAESVYTVNRTYDAFQNDTYTHGTSDEVVGVVELDSQSVSKWDLGLQLSTTQVFNDIPGTLVPLDRRVVSAHANGSLWWNTTLDAIYAYAFNDGGSVAELRYTIPCSDNIEFTLASDLFLGQSRSNYGEYRKASRVYGLFKAYLK